MEALIVTEGIFNTKGVETPQLATIHATAPWSSFTVPVLVFTVSNSWRTCLYAALDLSDPLRLRTPRPLPPVRARSASAAR